MEENIHFLTDKISEDISNRDREVFEYEGSMDNFHIKGNYVLFRKDSLFYKLEYTNKKFISRFNYVEQQAKKIGKNLKDMTIEEMDNLWNEAKEIENNK